MKCLEGRVQTPLQFLGDRLGLHEKQQVVAPAGLRVCARHIEAAERMHVDERAGTLAVQIEVADMEVAPRLL
jgi:hypothetical protein